MTVRAEIAEYLAEAAADHILNCPEWPCVLCDIWASKCREVGAPVPAPAEITELTPRTITSKRTGRRYRVFEMRIGDATVIDRVQFRGGSA